MTGDNRRSLTRPPAEERFQTLFEQSADASYLHDLNGMILNVSQRVYEQLGHDPDEIIGKEVWDLSGDSNPQAVRQT